MTTVAKLVTEVGFTPAGAVDVKEGLLGYVTCVLAEAIRLDGIALRLTADRRPTLSFPARTDRQGRRHPFIRPLDDRTRRVLEVEILKALGINPREGCDGP